MHVVVLLLGGVMVIVGVIGLINPRSLLGIVQHWQSPKRYGIAIVFRLVAAAALFAAAPACRWPGLINLLALITLLAAVALVVMGRARLDAIVNWWIVRPQWTRPAGLIAMGFGALLVYAAGW